MNPGEKIELQGLTPAEAAGPSRLQTWEPIPARKTLEVAIPEAPASLPFPVNSLPEQAQRIVSEVARVSFADVNLVAIQILPWMAAALGKGAVSIQGATRTYPNIFVLGIAGTGTGKSESARELGSPLHLMAAKESSDWETDEKPAIEARLREIGLELGHIDKDVKAGSGSFGEGRSRVQDLIAEKSKLEGMRTPPRLILEDFTQEALVSALASNDQSVMCFSTDAGKPISNLHGRYSGNTGGGLIREDTILLKGYSVESLQVDRMSRTQTIEKPCVTLFWLTQPGKIPLLYGDGALADGGFMPRVMPYLAPGGLPQRSFQNAIEGVCREGWGSLIASLYKLRGASKNGESVEFTVSREAADEWLKWDNANRANTQSGCCMEDVSQYVSRWGEWAQRIAVILQAAKFVQDTDQDSVTAETMREAIRIADWFANEQLRILQEGRITAREKETKRRADRAQKLEHDLDRAGGEQSLSELENRNGFSRDELQSLARKFPHRFGIEERPSATKPSTVCFLR